MIRYWILKCVDPIAKRAPWVIVPANTLGADKKRGIFLGFCKGQHYATRAEARRTLRPLANALTGTRRARIAHAIQRHAA